MTTRRLNRLNKLLSTLEKCKGGVSRSDLLRLYNGKSRSVLCGDIRFIRKFGMDIRYGYTYNDVPGYIFYQPK